MTRWSLLVSTALLAYSEPPLFASPAPNLRDPQYLALVDVGFEQIYNLEYEKAIATFSSLATQYPAHPGPPLDVAVTIWLRELFERQDLDLRKFIAPGYFTKSPSRSMPDRQRRVFFENIERSNELSQTLLQEHPGNRDARFFRGAAEGLLAAFSFTIDRSTMDALRHAKKAYRYHHELLEEDSDYFDAYMGVGLYEYIVDNLRWYVKWFARMIGYTGSEERGIEYLELARKKGLSVTDEASMLLMVVYFREKKNRDALMIANRLHRKFPKNFLFHLNQGQIMEKMRRRRDAVRTYLAVVRLAEEGRPNYQKLPLDTFRYRLAERFVRLGRPSLALRQYSNCVDDPRTPSRERALCHLQAGLLLDRGGKRDEAVLHYEAVLELPRFGDSHKKARRYLEKPYRGS